MAGRLVVVGGDAGGMAAAAQARRRDPSLEIVALEKGGYTSYSACGIPYLIGGHVSGGIGALVAREPQQFRDDLRIDVRLHHEVLALDLDKGQVSVRNHDRERDITIGFDKLHLGTGAHPVRPDLPGIDLPFVRGVQTLGDAADLLSFLDEAGGCERAVVVGGGYIGLEMAEAFTERGAKVTLLESGPYVMATLDPDMAGRVGDALRRFGVDVRTGTAATGFEPGVVHTASGPLAADVVVLGLGVAPNTALARDAGLELGVKGAIVVGPRQRTSHEATWAAGDCCQSFHLVSRQPVHIALGTVANKQGRVAGINIGGGYATFPGVLGTAVSRICATEVARTGLNEKECGAAGLGFVTATIESSSKAGYLPGARPVVVKLLAEPGTGRILGGQIIGDAGAGKRIDVVALAVTAGMTCADLVDADLAYGPPFGPLWDPVAVAARELLKQL